MEPSSPLSLESKEFNTMRKKKYAAFRYKQICVQILILPLTFHVTLNVFLNLSELQFIVLKMGTNTYRKIGSVEQNSKGSPWSLQDTQ